MNIKEYSPAQTLMITNPHSCNGLELIKFSFLDLIYNGILKIYKDWRLPHPRHEQERLYTFISRGSNFENYKRNIYQHDFVSPFLSGNVEFQVRTLIRESFKAIEDPKDFKSEQIYRDLQVNKVFKNTLFLERFGLFLLNKHGKNLQNSFSKQLKEAEHLIPTYVDSNPTKACELLKGLMTRSFPFLIESRCVCIHL